MLQRQAHFNDLDRTYPDRTYPGRLRVTDFPGLPKQLLEAEPIRIILSDRPDKKFKKIIL
jgi:hypothetical protein